MGQMEIIEKDLYIYTSDISYVDISIVTKKKVIGSESNPALYRSVRSKLLNTHHSINDDSFKSAEIKNSDSGKEKSESGSDVNFEDFHPSKCVRVVDEKDDYLEYCDEGVIETNKECIDEGDEHKGITVRNSRGSDKGKEKVIPPVIHNTRKRSESSKIVK